VRPVAEHELQRVLARCQRNHRFCLPVVKMDVVGVGWDRFFQLFARDRRKNDDGDFQQWVDGEPRPIIRYTVAAYVENESAVTKLFTDKIEEKMNAGLLDLGGGDHNVETSTVSAAAP